MQELISIKSINTTNLRLHSDQSVDIPTFLASTPVLKLLFVHPVFSSLNTSLGGGFQNHYKRPDSVFFFFSLFMNEPKTIFSPALECNRRTRDTPWSSASCGLCLDCGFFSLQTKTTKKISNLQEQQQCYAFQRPPLEASAKSR